MVIKLINFVSLWINAYLSKSVTSTKCSPMVLISCHNLDAKHYCLSPLDAYFKMHHEPEPSNSCKEKPTQPDTYKEMQTFLPHGKTKDNLVPMLDLWGDDSRGCKGLSFRNRNE